MSIALHSDAIARLVLCLALHAGGHSHAFELCELVFLLKEVSSLLVAVHNLSAECRSVFADLALYLAVGGLASMELSCSLTTLVLQARLAPIPRLPILAVRSFPDLILSLSSSSVVGSRSATSYLATARLSARSLHLCVRRLSCGLLEVGLRYILDLAASHHLGLLCNLDLFLKLRHVEEFPRCPYFTWDTFL